MSAPSTDTMRIYCHSVPNAAFPAWVEHTFVFVCGVGEACPTLRKLKTAFKEDLFRQHFSKEIVKLPIMTQGVLRDADGAELKDDAVIDQRLSDRDDVFFELKGAPVTIKPSAAQVKQAEEEKAKEKAAAGGGTIQIQDESGQPITIHRSELAGMTGAQQLHYTQLAHAREIQTKGQLRKARDIYLQVLATMPTDRNNPLTTSDATLSIKQICNQQLGVLYLHNKFYDLARPHLESAVKIITSSTTGVNGDVVKNIGKVPQVDLATLITMIGQCWFGIGDYIEAQPCFERALKLLTPKGEESKEKKVHAAIEDTKVWLARAMYRGGTSSEKSQALAMFEGIIAKNEHHIAALTYYAQIAIECGKKAEVVPYLLRALVAAQSAGPQTPKGASSYEAAIHMQGREKDPKPSIDLDPQVHELVQVLLTDLVSMPGGVKSLISELHAASSNHSALTFIAQTVKDQGGVVPSIEIYRRALQVCGLPPRPRSHLLLNLVHTMELEYQYQEAFDLIKQFCKENPSITTGTLKLGDFYDAVANIQKIDDPALRTGKAAGVPAYCTIGKIFDEGTCHVTVAQPGAEPPKKSTAVPYPSDELNLMALLFTAVKMLYICGGLQVLPTLINQLEPLRVDRDLHLTQIRNEHAYYSSIAQMMRHLPFPLPAELASCPLADTIYVCGDSHSMSAAWQVVRLEGHPRPVLLQPRLVTGLKCWHLRPSCRFYPKRNFEAAMRHIPKGASVIFNFGEIDCREGLIVAVEKGRYETVEEGIRLAVDVYIRAMQEQQAVKSLKVFVHPITPVLDVTRPTVKKFNAHMKERLLTLAKTAQPPSTALTYLDFFDHLLTADGSGFNMDYHLDSTHLKPTYVPSVLQGALNKVFGNPKPTSNTPVKSTMDAINERMMRASQGIFDDEEEAPAVDEMD